MNKYLLEWLDLLISVTLNPSKTDLTAVKDNQIEAIISQITSEKDKVQSFLKNQVFGISKESQIELLIKKYHSALIILLDEACANKEQIPKQKTQLRRLYDNIITCLDELLSFIEVRFSSYLSLIHNHIFSTSLFSSMNQS